MAHKPKKSNNRKGRIVRTDIMGWVGNMLLLTQFHDEPAANQFIYQKARIELVKNQRFGDKVTIGILTILIQSSNPSALLNKTYEDIKANDARIKAMAGGAV